jgi:hypothetical protein
MHNLSGAEDRLSKILKLTSSVCAVAGGVMVAANLPSVSKYGFILLAMSSSQLLIASLRNQDKPMIVYAGALFFFVDSLGIYRWIIQSNS